MVSKLLYPSMTFGEKASFWYGGDPYWRDSYHSSPKEAEKRRRELRKFGFATRLGKTHDFYEYATVPHNAAGWTWIVFVTKPWRKRKARRS